MFRSWTCRLGRNSIANSTANSIASGQPPTAKSLHAHSLLKKESRSTQTDKKRLRDLEKRIHAVKFHGEQLKEFLRHNREVANAEMHERKFNINTDAIASSSEKQLLEQAVSTPTHAVESGLPLLEYAFDNKVLEKPCSSIPAAIASRMVIPESNSRALFNSPGSSLDAKLQVLARNGGLVDIDTQSAEQFLRSIDASCRARNITLLEDLVQKRSEITQPMVDILMAGYAKVNRPMDVERLLAQSPAPGEHAFGNLARAWFVAREFTKVNQVLARMQEFGLEPNLKILTTVIQANISMRDYDTAEKLFTNMQYMSAATRPDAQLYAAMMLVASKQKNTNRVFDLYHEMTEDPRGAIKPNGQVLKSLIWACAKDPSTRQRGWQILANWRSNSKDANSEILSAMLFLCAKSGELTVARAFVKQLACHPRTYPDCLALNSLFGAYLSYKPGTPSILLTSQIRDLLDLRPLDSDVGRVQEDIPPFLPLQDLTPELIVAESEALMQFFGKHRPGSMTRSTIAHLSPTNDRHPATYKHIRIASKWGTFDEFLRRWKIYSYPETVSVPRQHGAGSNLEVVDCSESLRSPLAVIRDHEYYLMALEAAIQFGNLQFAQEIWQERGAYRRSARFRALRHDLRKSTDFKFARKMVEILVKCGVVDDAIELIISSKKLFRWSSWCLEEALKICRERDDEENFKRLLSAAKQSHRYVDALLHPSKELDSELEHDWSYNSDHRLR